MGIAHFALNLRTRHKCCHGVYYNNVNRAAADHRFRNFQRLFAIVRLRNIQVVNVHTQRFGICRIHCMLRVDIARNALAFLHLRNDMQRNRCFTGGFRSIDFDDPALWHAAHAQRDIQT